MASRKPLYRVSVSSSGLIYAVIVGAWAAYLVPMWLRRQDELNEARPTERFSTAIRLLSGRAGMERRYAKDLRARSTDEEEHSAVDPEGVTDTVDVRAFAMPSTRPQAKVKVQAQVQTVQQEQAPPSAPKREQQAQAERRRERVPAARRSAGTSAEAAARARRS